MQPHPYEAVVKSGIRAQRIPLWRDPEFDQTRLMTVDRLFERAEGFIEVAELTVEQRPLERGKAVGLRLENPADDSGPASGRVHPFHAVRRHS